MSRGATEAQPAGGGRVASAAWGAPTCAAVTNGLASCPQDSGVEMVSVLGLFPEQVSVGGRVAGRGRPGGPRVSPPLLGERLAGSASASLSLPGAGVRSRLPGPSLGISV